jgi:hypothetical protein
VPPSVGAGGDATKPPKAFEGNHPKGKNPLDTVKRTNYCNLGERKKKCILITTKKLSKQRLSAASNAPHSLGTEQLG